MSKSLEEILNGTTEDETVPVSPDETVTEPDPAAVASVVDDATAVAGTEDDTTVVTPDTETDDNEGNTLPQVEEGEIAETVVDTTFVPQVIHLTKAATLYGNRSATKVIGSFKGTVRQMDLAINGVAPIEYTVISAGNKIVKRAFIHI